MNTAAINANTTEQIQKVLDTISANRMSEMQNQINQLQLQSALCGVVRVTQMLLLSLLVLILILTKQPAALDAAPIFNY